MQCQPARPSSSFQAIRTVAVAGACVRQFAQSLKRSGLEVVSLDDFADWDTRLCGPAVRIDDRTRLVEALASHADVDALVICGGFEQHPDTVQATLRQRQIPRLGTSITSDKWELIARSTAPVERAGMNVPPVSLRPPVESGLWVMKPRRGAGGTGIRLQEFGSLPPGATLEGAHVHSCDRSLGNSRDVSLNDSQHDADGGANRYFQRFVTGISASALYLTDSSETRLLGVCLLGGGKTIPNSNNAFGTYGAVGPLVPNGPMDEVLKRGGVALAEEFALRGVWGIDLVLGSDGVIHFIELNPRPTSTLDLYELGGVAESLMGYHVACFQSRVGPLSRPHGVWAKSVLFWPGSNTIRIDGGLHEWLCQQANQDPIRTKAARFLADIPMPGEDIAPGHPIATLYCRTGRPTKAVHPGQLQRPFDAIRAEASRMLDHIRGLANQDMVR